MKTQATDSEKIFAKQNTDKGLQQEYIKNSLKSIRRKQAALKTWAKDSNRHFAKEDVWVKDVQHH